MKTPTPETEQIYEQWIGHEDLDVRLLPLCRKLERERDEARKLIKDTAQGIVTSREEMLQIVLDVTVERDQLRKVCDELANATRAEFGELNWRMDDYNQLHHVAKLHLPSGILRDTNIP